MSCHGDHFTVAGTKYPCPNAKFHLHLQCMSKGLFSFSSIRLKRLKPAVLKQEPFSLEQVKYQESRQVISAAFDYENQLLQAQDSNLLQNPFLDMFQTPVQLRMVIVGTAIGLQQEPLTSVPAGRQPAQSQHLIIWS